MDIGKTLLRTIAISAPVVLLAACGGLPGAHVKPTGDSVDFSFVFFGCNRVGWNDPGVAPSTANVAQLEQTLKDIANLQSSGELTAPPRYLFLLGDIVRNEADDNGETLVSQLKGWQQLWQQQAFSSSTTQTLLLPGNHEVLKSFKPQSSDDYYEIPNPPTYDKWLSWLDKNGFNPMAGNGPTVKSSPADQLVGDNSKLTWSFSTQLANGKNAHFVLINTDTLSSARSKSSQCLQDSSLAASPLPGWIPRHWINSDIVTAQKDPATDMIFAFGHKPITSPKGSDTVGRANILNCDDYPQADHLQHSFQDNSKFVGYLAAHVHQWDYSLLKHKNKRDVPQVIAGDGGSPLSGGDIFGYTLVKVYTSGKVTATSYGRNAPTPYYSSDAGGAATERQTVVLRQAD